MRNDFSGIAGWALATIQGESGPKAALETSEGLFDLSKLMAAEGGDVTTVADLFKDWSKNSALLDRIAANPDPNLKIEDGPRLAPIIYPGKVLCAGANYYRHLEEMGVQNVRKDNQRLFFFFKPARNAVVGEGATVHMPLDTEKMDWEIELAVVIGKPARAVTPEQAMAHVAGYIVAIDACARDLNKAPDTFYKLDWVAGKAQESCCPLGPRFVPASAIDDPQSLRLTLSVNGEKKQDDTTDDMIFSIAEQISTASRLMQLDPGDIILTGTPAGVGTPRGEYLNVGDRISAEIEGIGQLNVEIQPPSTEIRPPLN